MNQIVEWDEVAFLEVYPQFVGKISQAQFDALWMMACTLVDNTAQAIIPYDPDSEMYTRQVILWAVMCHLATMSLWGISGQSGPMTSGSEGSVSASFQLPILPGNGVTSAWYNQTPCGRSAWMLLRRYSLGGRYYAYRECHPYG